MIGFSPIDLTEGNVQAIFNRCLASQNTENLAPATLFPVALGYESGSEKLIQFDEGLLLKNKLNIEYLFGQLQEAHVLHKKNDITIDDYNTTYTGEHWTSDKATLLKLLYLGVSSRTRFILPFSAKTNTSMLSAKIKPTLSPKDPNFPAWWEEHKAEWEEQRKKGGQEPADD